MFRSPNTTLIYIEKNDCYLMLHRIKKEKDINRDKWIGVGGHFEFQESPEDCLRREVYEETGLTLNSFEFRGVITFVSDEDPAEYMFLYTSSDFSGELKECNEGILEWVPKSKLMDLNLWEGDKLFLKKLIDKDPFFTMKLVYENRQLIRADVY